MTTPTVVSLPPVQEVQQRYGDEIQPLAQRLETAPTLSGNLRLKPEAEAHITLVPLDERLYYIQTLLSPEGTPAPSETAARFYVTYGYERGEPLGRGVPFAMGKDTQEVLATAHLYTEMGGELYRVEDREAVGGAGSGSEKELVQRAVEPLEALGEEGAAVESSLEMIVGYATGLDWDESLAPSRRMTLLQWALTSPHWADRKAAAITLREFGAEAVEAVPSLIEALRDENERVRGEVEATLSIIGVRGGETAPLLLAALDDEDGRVRAGAAGALGNTRDATEAVVPALIQALQEDQDALVRRQAASSLGWFGVHAETVPALIQALQDEGEWVRHYAAGSLGRIGPEAEEAVPALIQTLGDEQEHVRQTAAEALAKITGQELGPDPAQWTQWWGKQP